jgi:hypothetical protein
VVYLVSMLGSSYFTASVTIAMMAPSLRATGGNTIEYNPGSTIQTTAFNRTVNQYILFTIQCQNIADVANIDMYKVFAYV